MNQIGADKSKLVGRPSPERAGHKSIKARRAGATAQKFCYVPICVYLNGRRISLVLCVLLSSVDVGFSTHARPQGFARFPGALSVISWRGAFNVGARVLMHSLVLERALTTAAPMKA